MRPLLKTIHPAPLLQKLEVEPALQVIPDSIALQPDVQQSEAALQEAVLEISVSDSEVLQSSEQADGRLERHGVDECACRLSRAFM